MAKRGPQSSLNHLNWNETDEPEEKGEFAKASDDVLKQRVIKKARRRVATDAADSTAPAASTSVFGAFKGFASTPLAKSVDKPDGAPTFSFLSGLGAGTAKTNGNGTATVSSSGADSGAAGSTKPMFSFGSNLGTIATSDANKKMFTFGTPNALKADSTEGAKNASSTSSGFGISSSKDGDKDSGKGLFSFSNSAANPINAGSTPTFSFGSIPSKPTDSSKPEKNFTFGSPAGNKATDSDTTAKPTFSFGSIAAKAGSGEAEKKSLTFGSPTASNNTSLNAASSTGMFNFGSNATKSDAGGDSAKKTFTFGSSPAAAKDTATGLPKGTFSFGSAPAKSDTSESERKSFAFGGSPAASKETATSATNKGIFSFGVNAAKPAAPVELSEKTAVTFGSPAATKDAVSATSLASPKGTFSFGSIPPKTNVDDGGAKTATLSFGSVAPGASLFGLSKPVNSVSAGAASPTKPVANSSEGEKKTFSFGIGSQSTETIDKSKATFAAPKENSEDTIKKMFSFASSTATPKGVDSGTKEQEKKSISIPLATTKPTAATTPVTPKSTVTTDVDKTVKSNVIALNKAFIAWITQKCNENAYCSLIPVFKNYEEYFAEINVTQQNSTAESSTSNSEATKLSFASKSDTPTVASLQTSMAASPVSKESEKAKEKTGFFFGTTASKESPTATKTVSLAAPPTTTEGFTFGGTAKPLTFGGFSTAANTTNTTASPNNNLSSVSTSSPSFFAGASTFASKSQSFGGFTFGNVVKPPAPDSSAASDNKDGDGGEADEDEPPKVEFTPVEEKDSLYSKRCKLFVKAGGSYSDRGVGTLHVKMVDSKVQVLVRADTSLGNILLNIILNESVPLQRLGKNNVMMICLPTPDSKPPPTSVLLRVKTTEEADQLYESLLKYKPK